MLKTTGDYKDYFHPGQRARIEISLQGDRKFDDGVVTQVTESQIALRLSQGGLPDHALLDHEAPLTVRVGSSGNGYSCRGVVLERQAGDELHVGLVDRVRSEDLREYLRLTTGIPVILFNVTGGTSEEGSAGGLRVTSDSSLPRVTNLSGGGFRTETIMGMARGDIVYATFNLPLASPSMIPVVAKVVHSEVTERADGLIFNAGLSFVHINENDRDTIVRFVCNEEVQRMRLCRKDFFLVKH
jgi:hypothetical protein